PAATLRWLSATHVDSYQVQVATDAAFLSVVSDVSVADTSYLTVALENCRTHYWRVRGKNASGTGPYASRNFRVTRALSSAPVLLLPADGTLNVDENTTLSWQAEPCAFQYRLELAKDSLFTQMVTDQTVTGTSLAVGPLDGNTDHFWRVRGVNNLGQGTPSAFFRFKTTALTTPPPPVLLSPVNGAPNLALPVTLCWDSAARTASYRLQVAVDSNFTILTYNDTASGSNRCKQFAFLLNSTTYYWRVNASNAAGSSAYSTVFRFTTLSPPPAPTLIFPLNNSDGVTAAPVFTWSVPENALSYRLQVARDPLFTSIFSDDSNLVNTSWQTGPLQSHVRYYWRVLAKNSVGTGPWSAVFNFRATFIGVANWLMPLAIRETGQARDTIYLGLHPDASCGIEAWLGEFELPPPPFPGTFDARFVSPGNSACDLGEGLRVNLLPFVTYTQADTYRVRFQPGTGDYPIVLSWDMNFITTVCDSMIVKDEFGGSAVYARMDQTGSVSVDNSSVTSLLLLKYGAFPLINDVPPPGPKTPSGYVLSQNYPNPFNPTTRITFSAGHDSRIMVAVYDVLGREIAVLADGDYPPGSHSVAWDGRNSSGSAMPSGAYYVRMTASTSLPESGSQGSFSEIRKMLLLK
ncbi:MAG TPA: FlgD immunoglobulin-like domain containing protein, partial [Bacteroidota bacterium]|nr:FlgD immunoglobulin-like domain containing protein [Bacteroidota bacterium]